MCGRMLGRSEPRVNGRCRLNDASGEDYGTEATSGGRAKAEGQVRPGAGERTDGCDGRQRVLVRAATELAYFSKSGANQVRVFIDHGTNSQLTSERFDVSARAEVV